MDRKKINTAGSCHNDRSAIPYRSNSLDVLVRCAQRGQSDLLRELGELGVGKERHMAEKLVTNVRLGGIERHAGVTDVLRRMEDTERQSSEEIP